jgi:hypothetical protein
MAEKKQNDGKNRLISLADASALYGFRQVYLATLARRGRLRAQKLGSIWVTTPTDMETFIGSRRKVGAYRDDIQVNE